MKRLLFVTPYPVKSIDMSACITGYFRQYQSMGYQVIREKVYFWEHKIWYSLKWFYLLRYLFMPMKAYMLHQHTIPGSGPLIVVFLFAAKILRRKTIVVSHETVGMYAKHLPAALRWIAYLYEWVVVSLSYRFIVHTRFHYDEVASFASQKRLLVIPHPMPNIDVPENNREKTTWGFYGMLSAKKGVDLLIDAYQLSPPETFPPLRIMGTAAPNERQYEENCKRRVRKEYQKLITFTGFVLEEDKNNLFSDLALMIFPYRYISQSGALTESCRYKIPYLAADLPFFSEYYHNYGCGKLFITDSVQSLHETFSSLVTTPLIVSDDQWSTMFDELLFDRCAERIRRLIEA